MAKEYETSTSSKSRIPWFKSRWIKVQQAAKDPCECVSGRAFHAGSGSAGKIIEDLIAKKADAITVVPNDDDQALEPVFKKAREQGIIVLTHEAPDGHNADWGYRNHR